MVSGIEMSTVEIPTVARKLWPQYEEPYETCPKSADLRKRVDRQPSG